MFFRTMAHVTHTGGRRRYETRRRGSDPTASGKACPVRTEVRIIMTPCLNEAYESLGTVAKLGQRIASVLLHQASGAPFVSLSSLARVDGWLVCACWLRILL